MLHVHVTNEEMPLFLGVFLRFLDLCARWTSPTGAHHSTVFIEARNQQMLKQIFGIGASGDLRDTVFARFSDLREAIIGASVRVFAA